MNTTIRLAFVAVMTVVAVIACDSVPLTSPTGSTISLSMDRTILPLGGQATVTAVVTESAGTPVHNGTVVTFQPSIGSVSPAEARTVNGVARATFLAGSSSGTGVVHAFSGPARTGSGNSSGGGVTVKVGTAAAFGAISVSASPSSVSQSGGTVTVSALVLDEATNPLPGVNVQFATSSGTLSQTTATTDSNGIARTELTTNQTATVNAVAGAAKGEVRVDVSAAPTVTLTVTSPATVGVPHPVTVAVGSGNVSPRQVVVDYGDGTSDTRTNVTAEAGFIHTYQREGGVTITARVTDVVGNTGTTSKPIVVQRSQPSVTLTSSAASVSVSGAANGTVTFTVNAATPPAGQPSIQSVVVRRNDGTVIYSSSATGSQQFAYRFDTPGTYTITATATDTAGSSATASTVVTVTP